MITFFTVALFLFALFAAAVSYREYFYIKALGGREAMDKMILHFGVSVIAALVLFVPSARFNIPPFFIFFISFILSFGASYSAFVGSHDLVRARYEEYRDWAADLIYGPYRNPDYHYQRDPFYEPAPEPVLPDDMNLPFYKYIEFDFDEYFTYCFQPDDKAVILAKEIRAKKLAKQTV